MEKEIINKLYSELSWIEVADYDWQQMEIDISDKYDNRRAEVFQALDCTSWHEVACVIQDYAQDAYEPAA